MRQILVATSNPGKMRDFAAAAAKFDVTVAPVPKIETLPPAREDAPTFEANACKKAEHYSRYAEGAYVLADDSGLEVEALDGEPGVHSARFAAELYANGATLNSSDEANNALLLERLANLPEEQRGARFVCCIAVAREGRTVVCFRGEVQGVILPEPRGKSGFGYDPVFYVATLGKTFGELSPEEKASVSHRGQAFRKFLRWYATLTGSPAVATRASLAR